MNVETLQRGSATFEEINKTYFTAFNNDITPSSIALPKSADEVAQLVKYAVRSNTTVAVKGAGHAAWKGAANIEDGLKIDLRGLSGIDINSKSNTVTIGAGEIWGNVYGKLAAVGLVTTGGRVARVGAVGLTLGGGLSFFSSRHGFVCDSVKEFEIVLASGEIVVASKNTNPDLFAALKGGGNNFGIVTKIELPTFPVERPWGGMTIHPGASYPDVAIALQEFATSSSLDPNAQILVSLGFSAMMGGELVALTFFHANHSMIESFPPSFSAFTAIEPTLHTTLRQGSIVEFVNEQSSFSVDGGRNLYLTTTLKPDIELLMELQELFRKLIEPIKAVAGLTFGIILQPMTAQMLARSAEAGPNAFGIPPGDGPYINVLVNPVWADAADDDRMTATALVLLEAIDKVAEARAKGARYRFMNYSYGSQKVIESYGEKAGRMLREVSKKYDPEGFFQKNLPGGFKLGIY